MADRPTRNQATSESATVDTDSPESIRSTVSKQRLILVVAGVLLGMLLAALDQTIVGTAMPRIIADLNGLNHYAWVFTAYMLASTVTVPIYGKLSDIYGRRIFFLLGMVIFLLGSALSGMSQTMDQLILFRFIQGLGAGALMPIAIAIIGDIFPPSERGKWQGLTSAVFGLASIVGPTLGGWLTDNWGWRWTFYVNMPVGALAIAVTMIALPTIRVHRQHSIDYLGATAIVAGFVPLLLAFSWAGSTYPWGSIQIVGLIAASVVLLIGAFFIELRAKEPIVDPRLFKNNIFAVSVIAMFLVSAGMFGAIMYLPLFIQGVVGESATNSGVVLTPMMLAFMVSGIVGGYLLSKTGKYKVMSLISFAAGALGMFLLSRMTPATSSGTVVRDMVVVGLGIGVSMSVFTIIVQNAFPFSKLGEVTAGLTFFRSIGSTIGVAVLGTVMTTQYSSAFASNLPASLKQVIPPEKLAEFNDPQALLAPGVLDKVRVSFDSFGGQSQQLFDQLMNTLRNSLSTAITDLFVVAMVALLLALVACIFLREIPLRKSNSEDPELLLAKAAATAADSAEPTTALPVDQTRANRGPFHQRRPPAASK